MAAKRPVVLTILDGWGYREQVDANAVALAHKPTFDHLVGTYPYTLIRTDGHFVGLPEGQMGNSEVGHMNIGSGRVLVMDVTKIDNGIYDKSLFSNPVLKAVMEHGRAHRLHLMGLVSDGGVHSHINHLFALLEMAKREQVSEVFVHCFMDGRDTPPEAGAGFVEHLQQKMREIGVGKIASVAGRYYPMDRDKRWERTQRGFNSMVLGDGIKNTDPVAAIRASYSKGVTDEFIEPIVITNPDGSPVGLIRDEDSCLFFNYRADRGRQLTRALTDPKLEIPPRDQMPKNLYFATMTQYDATIPVPVVIPPEQPEAILADRLQLAQLKNLRTAETEKYPHVTFYFNGGQEKPFGGEERELVASPKVATYDLKPEMSAQGVTDIAVKAIESRDFDVIIMNYANADMVGHTGKLEAAIKAVEAVDAGLTEVYAALKRKGGSWIVTADHGNAETMIDPVTGGPHTYHTTNPVPLIYIGEPQGITLRSGGSLRDISPTILSCLGLQKPEQMSGDDLRIIGD
jgi:2,3-bisphosphoglycerate-independent phosphoglycerate mutase